MSENLVQYVVAAGNGDTSAMGMLYAKTLKTSYFLASKLSESEAQAAEITKKVYARAFCSIDKLKKPEAFEIWLKQTVASIYKDSAKFVFADADANAQEPTTDFLPEDVLADEEKAARVIGAVSKLTPERRTAVILYYYNGMPVNVLSKFFGVSESTANAILGKARADILAYSGVEAPEFPETASLPVLTRILKEFTDKTGIENDTVREIFTFAIEAYAAAKAEAEAAEAPAEETPAEETPAEVPAEETAEVIAEETVEEAAEEAEPVEEEAETEEETAEEATEEVVEEAAAEEEEASDIETEIDEEKARMEDDILSFKDKISAMLGVDMDAQSEKSEPEAEEDAVSEAAEDAEESVAGEEPEAVAEETAEPVESPLDDEAFEELRRSIEGDFEEAVAEAGQEEDFIAPVPVTVEESAEEAPVQEESEAVTAGPSFVEMPIPEEKTEKKADKKSSKVNPKIIIAAVAILAVVIVGVVLLVNGGKGDDTPTTTTPVADTVKVPVEWIALPELSDYKNIEFLNEKVSSFKDSGKYGLIDYRGNVVLAAEYDGFERCSNGRYYGEGRLDESGYHILAIKGNETYEVVLMNGVAVVSNEPHADHATSNNTSMSGGDYDERDRYYEGYAAVRKNGKWGYVAQNSGKLVVPYEYEAVNSIPSDDPSAAFDYCRGSSNGYVAVKKDGKMGVIKIEKDSCKVVVDFTYEEIFQGEGGTFLAYNGKEWGNLKIGTVSEVGGADAPATETTTLPPAVTDPQEISIGKYVVNDDESNIRTSPETDNDDNVITALNKGYEITAFEKKEGSNGSEWVRFEYEGKEAWISSKKLDKVE